MSDLKDVQLNRRSACGIAAAAAAGTLGSMNAAQAGTSSAASHAGAGEISTDPNIVVETTAGRVRGFARGGIHIFKGVHYGDTTEGEFRFRPARPAAKWTGVRSSMTYGPVSPHPPRRDWGRDEVGFVYDWDDGYEGEDCLRVNIWTPQINGPSRRPVMVWIHGGAYTSGSSQELPSYDGENLARRGDIVLISLNHRLGPLGFMDLSGIGGGAFADSGNLGMLDLVEALRWVRDNVAAFGGDASNVTIFGQSGGGGKVSTLMAMPAAQGLFHRAIVMSGSLLGGGTSEDAQRLATATIQELGLAPNDIAGLQKVRTSQLIEAGNVAIRKLSGPQRAGATLPLPSLPQFGWQPVLDGRNIPLDAWKASAPEVSRHVPLMVGNVRKEFINAAVQFDEAELKARLKAAHGDKGAEIHGAFRNEFPREPPAKLFSTINAMIWRNRALDQLRMKQALGGAPAFNYWFTWQPQVREERAGAFHCIDLAFCFDNTKRCEQGTGDTHEAREVAATMSQAFINFAKTGNPGQPGLLWPAFDPATLPTMVFDRPTRVLNDPASEARKSVA